MAEFYAKFNKQAKINGNWILRWKETNQQRICQKPKIECSIVAFSMANLHMQTLYNDKINPTGKLQDVS